MDLTLVIPAYNEEKEVAATLEAAQAAGKGRFREIVVVDNASTDRTAEIAASKGARVIREEKKGLTSARRAGLEATSGELIAYIDADTHLSRDWFDTAERIFAENPHIVALSGPRRYFGTSRLMLWQLNALWAFAPLVYRIVGYMLLGGNFIARRDAIRRAGGFDETIAFYGEDTDLARRLSKVGKVLFRMDLVVHSSARRFEREGVWKPNITYALNYLWPALFGRPYTTEYRDVRNSA